MLDLPSRKSGIISRLKNPYTILLILVLLFALGIRLYYFNTSIDQGVWWDEGEYLLQAKHHAYDTPNTGWAAYTREPLMPIIWSFFFTIGLGETSIKFIQVLLSVATVYLTFLIGSILFDKKIGLISAALMSVFHHNLFFTTRALLAIPTLFMWLLSIYLFLQWYKDRKKTWHIIGSAIVAAIGFEIYYSVAFVAILYALFLILSGSYKHLSTKNLYIGAVAGILAVSPFLIYAYKTLGTALPKLTATRATAEELAVSSFPGALEAVTQINFLLLTPLFFLFLLGFGILLFNIVLGFDLLLKGKDISLRKFLFSFLWIAIVVIAFGYVGYTRGLGAIEPRYLIPMFPPIFFLIAVALIFIYDKVKVYQKQIALLGVLALLGYGMFLQVQFADDLIIGRSQSFYHYKPAGQFIKENSQQGDIVLGSGVPQLTYYTEREIKGYPPTPEELDSLILETNAKFMVVSIWQPTPEYVYSYPDTKDNIIVAQVYLLEEERPALIVYRIS